MPEEQTPLPPKEAIHQAGGGQTGGDAANRVKELNASVIPHLERIFESHAGPDKKWSKEQIITFLHHVQADRVNDPSADIAGKDSLDFNGFLHYMTSPASSVLEPATEQDLTWPLSSYYISSSHNTYLTGNQLYSDSHTDAYKNVLLRGCRCVEIDVWDGDDSDSESSESSEDEESKEKKSIKKASRKERLASKLPGSLTSRLKGTSLGDKLDKYTEKKSEQPPSATSATATNTTATSQPPATSEVAPAEPGHLKKAPTPQAGIVEPRVLHGYTLTKEVSFREVCQAIRDHAFTVTDLPLIVSLEVHCNAQQQEAMVNIMNQTWKDYLVEPPDNDASSLPPPSELKKKILVKVKYAPPGHKADAAEDGDAARLPAEAQETGSKKAASTKKKPSKIIQTLSKFGVYTRGVSFKSLAQPEAAMPTHIFSLSENGVAEVHEKQAQDLFKHNRFFMMRTYPSGMRIGSSNLDPPVFWRKGIQIVALNWQKWDEGMMLNEGMFAGTGGYVLKPEGYRGAKGVAAPTATSGATVTAGAATVPAPDKSATPAKAPASETLSSEPAPVVHKVLDLRLTVLGAQSIPLPDKDDKAHKFDPYLKIELHTEPPEHILSHGSESGKAKEGEYKAKTKTLKGVNPDFKGEVLEFKGVKGVVEELAFVRFLVKDDEIGKDDLAAWACVRLDRLRVGYRFVHLMDTKGRESEGAILVKVEKILK